MNDNSEIVILDKIKLLKFFIFKIRNKKSLCLGAEGVQVITPRLHRKIEEWTEEDIE